MTNKYKSDHIILIYLFWFMLLYDCMTFGILNHFTIDMYILNSVRGKLRAVCQNFTAHLLLLHFKRMLAHLLLLQFKRSFCFSNVWFCFSFGFWFWMVKMCCACDIIKYGNLTHFYNSLNKFEMKILWQKKGFCHFVNI